MVEHISHVGNAVVQTLRHRALLTDLMERAEFPYEGDSHDIATAITSRNPPERCHRHRVQRTFYDFLLNEGSKHTSRHIRNGVRCCKQKQVYLPVKGVLWLLVPTPLLALCYMVLDGGPGC